MYLDVRSKWVGEADYGSEVGCLNIDILHFDYLTIHQLKHSPINCSVLKYKLCTHCNAECAFFWYSEISPAIAELSILLK